MTRRDAALIARLKREAELQERIAQRTERERDLGIWRGMTLALELVREHAGDDTLDADEAP
jgi:hypothetical protein